MESAVDWSTVVKKYQVMKAEEAEHEGHHKRGVKGKKVDEEEIENGEKHETADAPANSE